MKQTTRTLALAVAAAAAVWIGDAVADVLLFGEGPFSAVLWHPGPMEVFERTVGALMILGVGVWAASVRRQIRDAAAVNEAMRARYAAILDVTSDAALASDLEGNITAFSPGAERMFGYRSAEVIGRPFSLLCPPELREEQMATWKRIIGGDGSGAQYATERLAKDGLRIPVELTVNVLRDTGGRPTGTTALVRDITERKAAEDALQERERRLSRIFKVAPIGFGISRDRVLVEVNDRLGHMVGRSPEELMDQSTRILYPDDEEFDRVAEARKDTGSDVLTVETLWRHKDGHILNVILNSSPIDRADPSKGAIFAVRDITDSRAAAEALRSSEARFRSVIEQSSQAIYLLADDRFELVNPRFCALTGFTQEEVTAPGFDFRSLLAPESQELIEDRRQARISGTTLSEAYEFTILHKSGSRVQVMASVALISYRDGEAVLGFLQDVTAQRAMESQLEQALRMESVGRLSGGVAHDLNNLLSPILGYGGLLLEDLDPDDPRRAFAEAIFEAGTRARDLVSQLLAFSRQQPLEMRALDANTLLTDFQQLLARTLREDIRIESVLAPDLPPLNGDRRQIEQVVMNLAVNAQDAMPAGGVIAFETSEVVLDQDFVRTHPGSSEGRFVRLVVRDTGEGMRATTQRRIFEPFFTTKEKGKGTGLGLSTVYGIVKQHGGYIGVQSRVGHGTVFSCYFPVADAAVADPPVATPKTPPATGHERVLVVEDEEPVRTLLVKVLGRQGYEVLEAGDGAEALELLEDTTEDIDLLVTDVVLPGMNGRVLRDEVTARSPQTRVLFMSGYQSDLVSERGVLIEDNFLPKPFSVQSLTAMVREVLDAPLADAQRRASGDR